MLKGPSPQFDYNNTVTLNLEQLVSLEDYIDMKIKENQECKHSN